MSTLVSFPSSENISTYIQSISVYPMLSEKEEYELATDYFKNDNLEAAKKLILSHLRYVVHIAKSFKGYNLPFSDLIQEGNIGLMKAVKDFNPEKGVRLASYAIIHIKEKIYNFVIKNFRINNVATTKAQRKLFFNLAKEKNNIKGKWTNPEERKLISDKLNVPEHEIVKMEQRMSSHDLYLGLPETDDDESSAPFELEDQRDYFEAIDSEESENTNTEKMKQAFLTLNERQQDIVKNRWLSDEPSTLLELSEKYGISAERVRQIEKASIEKMKKFCVKK